MFVLQITTLVMWDVAGEWFEINASQVIHLSQFKEDPNASLIAGLQSKDTYYKVDPPSWLRTLLSVV